MRQWKNKLVNHIAPAFTVLFCSHHACAARTTHNIPEESFPARRTRPTCPSARLTGSFCWPLLDTTSTGLRRTPSPRFTFGQACLQHSNFLSHARHPTHHTARHFGIVDTLLLLHDNLHHTKTTHAHLHLLACRIPSGRCWARVVNSPVVPLDQHGHGRKSLMFRVTSDGNWVFSTSCGQSR